MFNKILSFIGWICGAVVIGGFYLLIGSFMFNGMEETYQKVLVAMVYGGAALLSWSLLLKMALDW